MTFTESDWTALSALVFRDDYPGNSTARGVVEAPNGDPGARDTGKKYAHVATKYVDQWDVYGGEHHDLLAYLRRAHRQALAIAVDLQIPEVLWPTFCDGCLRVLEYPAGVGASAVHTDPDLFTINLWRNVPNPGLGGHQYHMGRLGEILGLGPAEAHHVEPLPVVQRSLVYFAIPDHVARIPAAGMSVGQWLVEQMKTMRYNAEMNR